MRRALWLSALALVLAGCHSISYDEVEKFVDARRTKAKFGVVANPRVSWAKNASRLRAALRYFAQEEVEAVVVLGELTAGGYSNQYREFATLWREVMPPGTRLVAVRGFEENANPAAGAGSELREVGTLMAPEGGTFEVAGRTFHASFAKSYSKPADRLGFYAQSPMMLTDELCFLPRASLSINASSLSGVDISNYYERNFDLRGLAQGLLVKVYSDALEVRRLDFACKGPIPGRKRSKPLPKGFAYAEDVAPPWRIECAADGACRVSEPEKVAPRFWDDTRLQVFRGDDGTRTGYTVRFPQVLAKYTGVRAFSYEVRCGKVVRAILPLGCHQSEDRVEKPVEYLFLTEELRGAKSGPLEFSVTPVSALGVRGTPITATVQPN